MRPAISWQQRNTPRKPMRAARRRTGIPRLRETPRTRASPFRTPVPAQSRERFLRGSCHAEPELGPHVVRTPAKWRARDLSPLPRYWPQTWASLSQVTTVGYSAFSLPLPAYSFVATLNVFRCECDKRPRSPGARPILRRERSAGAESGAVADATGGAGAPEGPARAHSRGAAPAARAGGRCRDRASG